MYPVDFQKRLEQAQKVSRDVNCISAAFFLLGIQDVEVGIDPFNDPSYVKNKFDFIYRRVNPNIPMPDEAVALGIWSNRSALYCHLGVVNPYNRDEIIHRVGYHQPLSTINKDQFYSLYGLGGVSGIDFLKLRGL